VKNSTARWINGAANTTNGIIVAHAILHDLNRRLMNVASPRIGALGIAVATARVNPDWISPYKK